ncbi:hypothetical protein [Lignipirellula cremea]|uniref:Uncharacterized protein n=1 Tax=Lignipirellula cremea TaxID=2528010 RepID=A0A518DZC5_9BACT|nr:hypothetical protein [Lignipirellula cremea]QDU97182.1 hypothetical protein Pla8534_50270 [Lignipirellula cremea]
MTRPAAGSSPSPGPTAAASPPDTLPEIRLFHIPCPNGHPLETPPELLDQKAICPHCHVKFLLRKEDSLEVKELEDAQRAEEQERRSQTMNKLWLIGAIIAAVVVVGFLALLMLTSG